MRASSRGSAAAANRFAPRGGRSATLRRERNRVGLGPSGATRPARADAFVEPAEQLLEQAHLGVDARSSRGVASATGGSDAREAAVVGTRVGVRSGIVAETRPSGLAVIARQALRGSLGPAAVFRLHGRTRPDALALVDDQHRLTYGELDRRIDDTAVFARVAPEHKMRIVAALQRKGHVVAMTGDGVNDAPALKKADIGVAMGITGTDVSKEAATMVLTDDNFATIVEAVGRGRAIYANIVKFVRFQLSTTLGFALVFLFAALLGIGDGKPFTAIAILWVNIIMDGPPAMALAFDSPVANVMQRPPRPVDEPILTKRRWSAVIISSIVMAAGTLLVLKLAPGEETHDAASVATTMAFVTFVFFQFFNILNSRNETHSVFNRRTFTNWRLWAALGASCVIQVGVTVVGPLQDLFNVTSITVGQWLICAAVAGPPSPEYWAEPVPAIVLIMPEVFT